MTTPTGSAWTFGRRIGLGFAAAALVQLIVAAVSHSNIVQLIDNDRWVTHTAQVRTEIADLLAKLKDVQIVERNFLVTGEVSMLDGFDSMAQDIDKRIDSLRALTTDNAAQTRRIDTLRPLVEARVQKLREHIEVRKAKGFEAASQLVIEGSGLRLMQQIEQTTAAMDDDERQLMVTRHDRSEQSASETRSVIIFGSAFGVLLVALIGYFLATALAKQIGSAVVQIQSSSTELQASANQQVSASKEQATAMAEITTTIHELLATSRQIAGSAQRVSKVAEQTSLNARSGVETVELTRDSMSGIRRQVDLIVSHMLELGKKSQQINVVLDIVSELAEQTNILAINATIEAAGAGETGRRFGVVADEIRKLADRVAGSTKEIRVLIDDVRGAVNTTVMATESGSKAVDAGSKHFSDVAVSFRAIASSVQTATEAAREIELSTTQQTTAVEQVNLAIANVAQASRESEAGAGQTLQTASQLTLLARQLVLIFRRELDA